MTLLNPSFNAQNIAADPRASCFLTANAGSGKTSTLVNRVARLLLAGASPERILCVTYTKAAAAEMQSRLFERLGHWAVTDDERLAQDLHDIDAATRDLARARALFARALETPGGLKIQTIHAFCEKLLRRFPLEAGLSPAFQVLDDLLARDLSQAATDGLLTLDATGVEETIAARDRLIVKLKAGGFEKLLTQFVYQHDDIRDAFETFQARAPEGKWVHALFVTMGLDAPCSSHDCLMAYAEKLEWQIIRDLASALSLGQTATNRTAGQTFLNLLTAYENEGRFDFDALKTVFFTATGSLRKSPYTKETSAGDALLLDRLAHEVSELTEQVKTADIASDTLDALRLFTVFSFLYQAQKSSEGALDFQDLINRTRQLLTRADMAAWVLFKLDGGIDHILVDEAQDTSGDQWAIVRALSEEFFAGLGQETRDSMGDRTIFAVGDEKQSIYGFQGAKPDLFLENGQYFERRVTEAGGNFVAPDLVQSWRSLPAILRFVDAVYDDAQTAHALNFTGNRIVHEARRSEAPGCVELWPMVMPIDAPEVTVDDDETPALDQATTAHPAKRLAQQLAATIRKEIAAGRSVFDKTKGEWRPMHAGDVLILVRKRDLLFEHIIRELKQAGVAVSGADRLKLGEHIAFQDLRALMRFCLQPRDDLSLACVLRSPLCSLGEQDLYDLAQGRSGTLWHALIDRGGDSGPFAEARVFLAWALKAAAELPAFDFLSRVLNRRDDAGRSVKQRFLTRLGDECEDVLDETLALALKGEAAGRTGLSACLDLFEFNASEIKREQEEGGRSVRVMTVHGSKGLEAPWVILPFGPNYGTGNSGDLLLMSGEGLYLCAGGKACDTRGVTELRQTKAMRDDQESLRLLYVALTRARDRLTLCGYSGKRTARTGNFPSWYDLCDAAFNQLDDVTFETMALKAPFDDGEQAKEAVIRITGARNAEMTAQAHIPAAKVKLPAFISAPVQPDDAEFERWTAISHLEDEDRTEADRAPSPLQAVGTLGRYRRGNLIHKLFEFLPDIAPASRDEVAARYLLRQADLKAAQRDEMRQAVMTVLNDARFAEAFGPDSRPEVALAGQVGVNAAGEALMLSGRIDRLVVTPDRVLIIDYKSNRPAPDTAEDAPVAYQRQMAGYVALLRQIHPERRVEAALLWTDGPKLTPLSDALVNLRLGEITGR